ncbi:plasmid mobilization relaxosome protein MobC [Rhodopseudomonas palustris]|uniref:plasmid mobilization protein n=1 Tax=Rhodopseudomonas palustris TaxID=1076 RepID=UPI0022F140CE|nr:plasmid mobilization relaxosome protein MobC [Rhodopseudomonas palustris]WBU30520.1 plasmid mobilization relaxosome protein MobC [Rhodopseudomonas palustris]
MSRSDDQQKAITTTTTFRMTAAERAAIVSAADAAGMGPSTFARVSVLRAAGRTPAIRKRHDAIATVIAPVLGQLGRIGSNINQITRHAHIGGNVDSNALARLRDEMERLTRAVLALGGKPIS